MGADERGEPVLPREGVAARALTAAGEPPRPSARRSPNSDTANFSALWSYPFDPASLEARDEEAIFAGVLFDHYGHLPVKVVRVLDAMHACGYVDTLAKALEKDEGKAAKRSEQLRRRLVNAGWEGFLKSFHRVFGAEAELRLDGDGRKAWDYLWKRREQMDYRRLRRRHLVIGSGMVESACKLLIGTRLTGPGMHWRFANGVRIAMLRAAMRSRLKIAA